MEAGRSAWPARGRSCAARTRDKEADQLRRHVVIRGVDNLKGVQGAAGHSRSAREQAGPRKQFERQWPQAARAGKTPHSRPPHTPSPALPQPSPSAAAARRAGPASTSRRPQPGAGEGKARGEQGAWGRFVKRALQSQSQPTRRTQCTGATASPATAPQFCRQADLLSLLSPACAQPSPRRCAAGCPPPRA